MTIKSKKTSASIFQFALPKDKQFFSRLNIPNTKRRRVESLCCVDKSSQLLTFFAVDRHSFFPRSFNNLQQVIYWNNAV